MLWKYKHEQMKL